MIKSGHQCIYASIGAYDSKIFQLIVGISFKYDIREKYLLEKNT